MRIGAMKKQSQNKPNTNPKQPPFLPQKPTPVYRISGNSHFYQEAV